MANWFCSVFNAVCRKRLSSPRCISELIDSAWVVIVPGQQCPKVRVTLENVIFMKDLLYIEYISWLSGIIQPYTRTEKYKRSSTKTLNFGKYDLLLEKKHKPNFL